MELEPESRLTELAGVMMKMLSDRIDALEARVGELESKPENARKAFVKPTLEEVKKYIKEKGYNFSAELFFNRNEELQWTVRGRGGKLIPMTSWRGVCATWEGTWRDGRKDWSPARDEVVQANKVVADKEEDRIAKLKVLAEEQLKKIREDGVRKAAEDLAAAATQRPEMGI